MADGHAGDPPAGGDPAAAAGASPAPVEAPEAAAWHRLSTWAALPVALGMLRGNLLNLAPALAGAAGAIATIPWLGAGEIAVIAAAGLAALAAYALAWQHRFRYRIDAEGISVRSGVFHRSEVRLTWQRVRNVDLRQAFYLRPLDRVALALESSGGREEEVTIEAVPRGFAEQVRERVARSRPAQAPAASSAGATAATPGTVGDAGGHGEAVGDAAAGAGAAAATLHHPTSGELLLHGAINGRGLALLLAGIGGLYGAVSPATSEADLVELGVERVAEWVPGAVVGVMVAVPLALALTVVLVAISAVAALVRFYDFTLTRDVDRFRLRHGLLETRERTLRTGKLQALTVVETAVGRRLGRCHLLAHQATSAGEASSGPADGTAEVPALTTASVGGLVTQLDPALGPRPPLAPIEAGFRRFWLQRSLAAVVVAALALAGVLSLTGALDGPVAAALAAAAAAVAAAIAWLVTRAARNWGWALVGDVVFITSGVLGRRHQMFRIDRVQQVTRGTSPYQRRRGLATITLSLADGGRRIPFVSHADAVELANRVLHRTETAPHLDL